MCVGGLLLISCVSSLHTSSPFSSAIIRVSLIITIAISSHTTDLDEVDAKDKVLREELQKIKLHIEERYPDQIQESPDDKLDSNELPEKQANGTSKTSSMDDDAQMNRLVNIHGWYSSIQGTLETLTGVKILTVQDKKLELELTDGGYVLTIVLGNTREDAIASVTVRLWRFSFLVLFS